MKIKDQFGITSYLVYGTGSGHYNIDATKSFKLHRFFVDNFRHHGSSQFPGNIDTGIEADGIKLATERTYQNFQNDKHLQSLKAEGVKSIWCTQGKFDFQDTIGKAGKVLPLNEADDPSNPKSYWAAAALCKQVALRYANDTADKLDQVTVWNYGTDYRNNVPLAGLDLIDAIEIQNEWDFKNSWSGASRTITPEQYAACFKACYDSIRSVSNIKVIMGGGISPIMSTFTRFLAALDALYALEGKQTPNDFYLCFHWYMRNGSSDQGGGTAGVSPEVAKAYEFGQSLDALCEQRGLLGWYCTETGWATDTSKQQAPVQQGFTKAESQGILMVRLALIWGACRYFSGTSYWHCRDDYDLPPYAKGGVNDANWNPKPARTISETFLTKYGDKEIIPGLIQNQGAYSVKFTDGTQLSWSDGANLNNLTPMPQEVTIQMPKHLEIKNNILHLDGAPFKIIEGNSPESRLRDLHYPELDELNSYGVNTLMCTLFGGDITSIHPFKDRSNPSLGFDDAKVNLWVAYFRKWVFGYAGKKHILHLLLSEKENHYELSEANHKAMIDYFNVKFAEFDGYIIYNREELDIGKQSYINTYYSYLKQICPNNIRGMHNNTNEDPWNGFESSDLVQLLALQEWEGNFDRRIKELTAKNPNWCAYVSEVTGGFQPTDIAKTEMLFNAGGVMSSGISFFISTKDHAFPDFQPQYKDLYLKAYQLSTGVVVPPPPPPTGGNMQIGYSTKADRSDFKELGANLPAGNYFMEARSAVAPVVFSLKKDGVVIQTKTENGAPFDLHGGNTFNYTDGSYELSVTDKSSQKVISFSVGTVSPPPPPPVEKINVTMQFNGNTYSGDLVKV